MAKNIEELKSTIDNIFEDKLIQKCIQNDDLKINYPYTELAEDYRIYETTEIDFDYNISTYKGIEHDLEIYIHQKFEEHEELTRSTYLFIRSVINMTLIKKFSIIKDAKEYKLYNNAYFNMVEYFKE